MEVADLARSWHFVYVILEPRDLCSVIQACKSFQEIADVPAVWRAVAQRRWPSHSATLGAYNSYKALALDDNRQNVEDAVPLTGKACRWQHSQAQRFYECRLLQLVWRRSDQSLRLYFDARGELDLRFPDTSSLAVVELKDGQLLPAAAAAAGPGETAAAAAAAAATLQPGGAAAAAAAEAAWVLGEGAGAVPPDQTAAAPGGGWFGSPGAWSRRMASCTADTCRPVKAAAGHYKGELIWTEAACTQLLQALWPETPSLPQEPSPSCQQPARRCPAPQHSHQQRGRRSQAWEEWAQWQMAEDGSKGEAEEFAGQSPAGGLMALLQGGPGRRGDPAPRTRRRMLVFCYANNLEHCFEGIPSWFWHCPDYSVVPLISVTDDDSRWAGAARGSGNIIQLVNFLSSGHNGSHRCQQQEAAWAVQWRGVSGAVLQPHGQQWQQLEQETVEEDKARWKDLPFSVQRRGEDWWV